MISCGKCNKYFAYIIIYVLFNIANNFLYGLNHNESFEVFKIFKDDIQNKFSKHTLIHNIFSYLGTIFLGILFYKIEICCSRKESNLFPSKKQRNSIKLSLIHNDDEEENFKTYKSFCIFLFIIFLWILEEQLIELFRHTFKDLDFWMIELFIISMINKKMFKTEIFKHQIFAIILNIIPTILKAITVYLSFEDKFSLYEWGLPIYYINNAELTIPIGIIIYLALITLRSYVNSSIKWYMELKYISLNKLLVYYGLFGTIFCSIICGITTFNECKKIETYQTINNGTNIFYYLCKINSTENELTAYYLENIKIYLQEFEGEDGLLKNLSKEILVIVLGIITFFGSQFFFLLVIKYLSPVHVIFSFPILYLIQKAFMVSNTFIKENKPFKDDNNIKIIKFYLDISGDIFSFIGFLIYLEIIILKFYKYDYNIKENITRRSFGESYGINEK